VDTEGHHDATTPLGRQKQTKKKEDQKKLTGV